MKRIVTIALVVLMILTLFACGDSESAKYKEALDLLSSGNTSSASAILSELGDYKAAREVWFYIKEQNNIKQNNEVEQSARELSQTINRYAGGSTSVGNSKIESIKVAGKSASNGNVTLSVTASCSIIDFDLTDGDQTIHAADSFYYSINCNKYNLDVDTCAKIIVMTIPQLVEYANSK